MNDSKSSWVFTLYNPSLWTPLPSGLYCKETDVGKSVLISSILKIITVWPLSARNAMPTVAQWLFILDLRCYHPCSLILQRTMLIVFSGVERKQSLHWICVTIFNSVKHRTSRDVWLGHISNSPVTSSENTIAFALEAQRFIHLGWLGVRCDDHQTRRMPVFKTWCCNGSVPTGIVTTKT